LVRAGDLEGKWDNLRGCGAEKGVHFLGLCRLRRMRDCWLELQQELLNCESIKYCETTRKTPCSGGFYTTSSKKPSLIYLNQRILVEVVD
jgi:hypothetical protein